MKIPLTPKKGYKITVTIQPDDLGLHSTTTEYEFRVMSITEEQIIKRFSNTCIENIKTFVAKFLYDINKQFKELEKK